MPKVKDLIQWLQDAYDPEEFVAYSLWTTADVQPFGDERDIDLTEEEMGRVLERANNKQDCSVGINWDVLGFYVDEVIRERSEADETKKTETGRGVGED